MVWGLLSNIQKQIREGPDPKWTISYQCEVWQVITNDIRAYGPKLSRRNATESVVEVPPPFSLASGYKSSTFEVPCVESLPDIKIWWSGGGSLLVEGDDNNDGTRWLADGLLFEGRPRWCGPSFEGMIVGSKRSPTSTRYEKYDGFISVGQYSIDMRRFR